MFYAQKVFFIQMMKGLHVINKMVFQLMNKSFVLVSTFKYYIYIYITLNVICKGKGLIAKVAIKFGVIT
jgi:hypothetical protein